MKYSDNRTDIKQFDLKFGLNKEREVLPIFNTFFNCNATIATDKYSILDYYDDNKKICGELKSRRVNKHKYPTTMIGYNKVLKGREMMLKGYDVYFLWCFTNKLCYYKLDNDFKEEWVIRDDISRTDRGRDERSDVAYIPTTELKNIYKFPK